MNNTKSAVYRKLILVFLLSTLLTALTIYLLYKLAFVLLYIFPFSTPIQLVINKIGSKPVTLISAGMLFFLIFIVLSRKMIGNLNEVKVVFPKIMKMFIYTIRWKFIFIFFISIFITIITVILLHQLFSILIFIDPFRAGIRWIVNKLGSFPVMFVSSIILFLMYFFIFSRRMINYLDEIKNGLQEIAKGNLTYEIPTKSSDELGMVADTINQMTKQLKKSIEEERNAERTKNELITGVSHDLRTPLTSILGYLELIEKDHYKDEVELRYYTNIAYEKALRLKKLVEDLFEYTSIHEKGPTLQKQKINLNGLLKQLAEEFSPSLTKAGMLYRTITNDEMVYIYADGNQLMRAYENLMANAIRYGKDGQYIDIQINKTNEEAIVKIINYGEQIPERDLPYIFERFYRAEKSRSTQSGGSGLGLAITKSIVEMNGGHITVESNKDGTVFETRFPLIPFSSV